VTYPDIYNGIPYGMNGMAKVELYERFLHTLVVAYLIGVASARRHLISARPAFSEFL